MNCKHPLCTLVRLEGPLHDNDDPPQYRCHDCGEIVTVRIEAFRIAVFYGRPQRPVHIADPATAVSEVSVPANARRTQ